MSTLLTITSVYRHGEVELSQRPEGLGENAAVLVTFLRANGASEPGPAVQAADAGEEARRAEAERFLARLKKGIPFSGAPYPRRDDFYDRVQRLIDRIDGREGIT